MKKNDKAVFFIAGAIILAGVAITSYVFGKSSASSPVLPSTEASPSSQSHFPADASQWKTYTNAEFGISFQYPPTFSVNEYHGVVTVHGTYGVDSVPISIQKIDTKDTLAQYWNRAQSMYQEYIKSDTLFQGRPAYLLKRHIKDVQVNSYIYIVQINGYLLRIEQEAPFALDLYTGSQLESYRQYNEKFVNDEGKVIDQILSTFKFVDPNPTANPTTVSSIPADWKSYDKVFAGYHFIFRYPLTYTIQDQDESSGDIFFFSSGNQNWSMYIDTFANRYGPVEPYDGGSRREWYKRVMHAEDPTYNTDSYGFVDIVAGKNSFLKVTNTRYEDQSGIPYIGVLNNIPVIAERNKTMDEKEFITVLSTLSVSK